MAMHVAHQSNDIVPNSFPPPRPTPRHHGMVSEYEAQIVMHKTAPFRREIEGGVPFEKDEEYPIPRKPRPMSSGSLVSDLFDLDPALCVTPEKQRKPFIHTQKLKGSGGDSADELKSSQKVRFDQTVEVKQMSPETPAGVHNSPDSGLQDKVQQSLLSNIYHPTDDYLKQLPEEIPNGSSPLTIAASDFHKSDTFNQYLSDNSSVLPGAPSKYIFQPDGMDNDPVSIVARDMSRLGLAGQDSGREEGYLSDSGDKEVAAILNTVGVKEAESVLARPEFNSVLLMSEEKRHLEELQPDVIQAAQKKLRVSDKDKTKVEEKVSGVTSLIV